MPVGSGRLATAIPARVSASASSSAWKRLPNSSGVSVTAPGLVLVAMSSTSLLPIHTRRKLGWSSRARHTRPINDRQGQPHVRPARDERGRAVHLTGTPDADEAAGTEAGEQAVADHDHATETEDARAGIRGEHRAREKHHADRPPCGVATH